MIQTTIVTDRDPMTMKTPEAAAYLAISQSTLCKRRVYGNGPKFVRLGRAVVYRKCDLDAWLDACSATSTSEPRRLQ